MIYDRTYLSAGISSARDGDTRGCPNRAGGVFVSKSDCRRLHLIVRAPCSAGAFGH